MTRVSGYLLSARLGRAAFGGLSAICYRSALGGLLVIGYSGEMTCRPCRGKRVYDAGYLLFVIGYRGFVFVRLLTSDI
jgi:hypothetical protein